MIENKIELLWNGSNSLSGNLQVHKLLKSYYINSCRKLAKSLQIPKEKFATSQMCPHCGIFWQDAEYGLKLIPKHFSNKSKTKKLIENLEQTKATTSKILNKKQRNRAKWLRKKTSSHLAISCYQCKHKSSLKMETPKNKIVKDFVNEKIKTIEETPLCDNKSINKKSKKKSKNVCITAQESSNSKTVVTKHSKEKKPDNSSKTFKSKNKKSKIASTTKVISKTQKQNSLLQLAALLQKQSKNDEKNSAQKRLESLLK